MSDESSVRGVPPTGATEALQALRLEVEAAHDHVQQAQRIAYGALRHEPGLYWTRLALNRAQSILIQQLVHRGLRKRLRARGFYV